MAILNNRTLLSLLENNKEIQKEEIDAAVKLFSNILDASLNDATYEISKDGRYITIEDNISKPMDDFPTELLNAVCDKLVTDRGFSHVHIKIIPGEHLAWCKAFIQIYANFEVFTKSVQVDIVDHSDDEMVDHIIDSH